MKQGFKKIMGSLMSSAMMLSMVSFMGIVTQASVKDFGVTFEITTKQEIWNKGSLDYFQVKGVKESGLELTSWDVDKAYNGSISGDKRDDRYPLIVKAGVKVKPGSSDTIGSITRVDVSDALQYCSYYGKMKEFWKTSSESNLEAMSYYVDPSGKKAIIEFVLIPYQLNLFSDDMQSVGAEVFYGVAGNFYQPKYETLLNENVFPKYKNEQYTYVSETYSSTDYAVGGGAIEKNIVMHYKLNPLAEGVFGGFGRNAESKYMLTYKNGDINNYFNCVCATINYNVYLKPRWKKTVDKADCYNAETTTYIDTDTEEEYYEIKGNALGHNWVHNSSKDIPGTVTKPAQEYWECKRCHEYEYRDGAKATTKEGKIGEFDYVFDNKNDAGVFTIDDVLPIEIPDFPGTPAAPFEGFSSLVKKIVFKSGKTTAIGDSAFSGLDNSEFTSVSLPANVTRIGDYAFMDSKALKNVTFNGDNLEEIGTKAFFGTSVKEVTIPKSVKTIGAAAFGYVEKDGKTTEVKGFKIKGYPGTEAEKYAKLNGFEFVDLTKAAPTKAPTAAPTKAPTAAPTKAPTAAPTKAPAGTTTPAPTTTPNATVVPTTAPGTTTAPQTTDAPAAPATVTSEGQNYAVTGDDTVAYSKPEASTDKVTIPDSITVDGHSYKVTAVNDNAFKNDKTIKEVVIGKNVKTIGDNAFSGCTKLKTVTGAANVTKIGNNAFKNCKALTKITIGKKVKEIGKNAFSGCKKLSSITVKSKVLKKVGKNAFKSIAPKAVFKLPKKKFAAEKKLITASKVAKTVKFKKG